MPPPVAKPAVLTDPGFLWIAPIGTAAPADTVTAGKFSDAIASAYIPLGATTEGSTFSYSSTVEAIRAAEIFDVLRYVTTERQGNIAFNLMGYTLSNYKRAMNGGVSALVATGVAGSELTTLEPPDPGTELRSIILWESTDATLRLLLRQTLQGGEISSAFQRAPSVAAIPCTFNLEVPDAAGVKPFKWSAAGTTRV